MPAVTKRLWTNAAGEVSSAYVVSYVDRAGKRRRKQFKRKSAADEFASVVTSAVRDGSYLPDKESITVKEALERWLEACRKGRGGREAVEPHTLRVYGLLARVHIEPFLGGMRLTDLTPGRVKEFRDKDLLGSGRSRSLTKKVLTALSSACREAVVDEKLGVNPCVGVHLVTSGRHKDRVEIPSKSDVQMLVTRAKEWTAPTGRFARSQVYKFGYWRVWSSADTGKPRAAFVATDPGKTPLIESTARAGCDWDNPIEPRWHARWADGERSEMSVRRYISRERTIWFFTLLKFMIATGVRLSEARGAAKNGLNLDRQVYLVNQRADEKGVIGPVKSGAGRRELELPAALCEGLEEWLRIAPEGPLLFPNLSGRPEPAQNIYKRFWLPLQVECGIASAVRGDDGRKKHEDTVGMHTLRHFHASLMIEAGMPPKQLQEHMGHSSINITMDVYGHLFRDDEARARRRLIITDKVQGFLPA